MPDIETLSIDKVLNKEHFYGKNMQKMCPKTSLRPIHLFYFFFRRHKDTI